MPAEYFTGLDLGQLSDFSALVVVERAHATRLEVQHIVRWHLGTSYPQIVSDVKQLFSRPPLQGSPLIVDGTGVGVAVVDLFELADIDADLRAYSITAGLKPGDGTVPKKDLVGAVQVALGTKELKIAPHLPLADVLVKELQNFRVKVTEDRNETFGSWRDGDNDDVVLSLALALWYAYNHGGSTGEPRTVKGHFDHHGPGTWRKK